MFDSVGLWRVADVRVDSSIASVINRPPHYQAWYAYQDASSCS